MKRYKAMEYTRKLTPRQLALAELKTPERADGPITLADFIKNCLIPGLHAKKRKVILSKGKVSDVCEFSDGRRQLQALVTVCWLKGLLPLETRMPAELKDVVLIIDDPSRPEPFDEATSTTDAQPLIRRAENCSPDRTE